MNDSTIKKIISKDAKACNAFYREHYNAVKSIAKRYSSDKMIVDDYIMVSFEKIFDKIHTMKNFDNKKVVNAWIRTVTNNEIRRLILKNRKEVFLEKSVDEYEFPYVQSIGDEQVVMPNFSSILTKDEYDIFTLYYFKGLNCKEISEKLSINESTVKVRLFRARNRINSENF